MRNLPRELLILLTISTLLIGCATHDPYTGKAIPNSASSNALSILTGIGSVMVEATSDSGGLSSDGVSSAIPDSRFPLKIEFVPTTRQTNNKYYKPLGCVVYVRRTEHKTLEKYNVNNICDLRLDYFLPTGHQDQNNTRRDYNPNKYHDVPSSGLRPRALGVTSVFNAGPVLSCLTRDSLKRFHKVESSDIDGFDGLLCKSRPESVEKGPASSAN